jgi:hypothetical protein
MIACLPKDTKHVQSYELDLKDAKHLQSYELNFKTFTKL